MELKSRDVFCKQPGHSVLFDLSPSISPDHLNSVTNKLVNILQLSDKMRGSIRIPAFGLYVIANEFHTITKLNSIKNNWTAIKNGITLIKQITLNQKPTQTEFEDNLNLALQSMLNDIADLSNIEITFISMKEPDLLMTLLTSIITNLSISKLQNIQIIPLCQANEVQMNFSPSLDFIQIVRLPLSTFFRTWLLDYNNNPDVILKFPEQLGSMELFCNLQECVLNPTSIPYGHAFQLQSDALSIQLGYSSRNNSSKSTLPIHKLEIINRLSQGALCDISDIGIPYCITATNSLHLNEEKAKENEDRFSALCYTLGANEECLLARQFYDGQNGDSQVFGRFAIIPGDNLMVIRALAVAELMQPFNLNQSIIEKPNESAMTYVHSTLAGISILSEYKPEEHESGLFEVLSKSPASLNIQKKLQTSGNVTKESSRRKKVTEQNMHPALMDSDDIDNVFQNKRKYKK